VAEDEAVVEVVLDEVEDVVVIPARTSVA
jgi:hypothetical protein